MLWFPHTQLKEVISLWDANHLQTLKQECCSEKQFCCICNTWRNFVVTHVKLKSSILYICNVNIIYFMLCCIYGNFTHGMNVYFLLEVLTYIALYLDFLTSFGLILFVWVFQGDLGNCLWIIFYCVCIPCILLCSHFPSLQEYLISAWPYPEWQAPSDTLHILMVSIWIVAHYALRAFLINKPRALAKWDVQTKHETWL